MVVGVLPTATPAEINERVEARAERQKLLDGDDPLELWAVVDERRSGASSAARR